MKKTFVSIGLAASAAGLSSAFAQDMESVAPKIWNISGTLRGFYDDNYNQSNTKQGSWGFQVSPSISANLDLQQTDIGARYTFGMYYYFDRAKNDQKPIDYSHQADVWLDHAFSETFKVNLTDSLVIAQDPTLLSSGGVNPGSPTRVGGNDLVNSGEITLTKDWTRRFSTAGFYGNNYIIYSGKEISSGGPTPPGTNPSQADILNRIEQNVGLDLQWQFSQETMGFVGYKFAWTQYTGDALITPTDYSDARNNNIQYGYVGVQHEFSPNLSGRARGGASYVDMYNDPTGASTSVAPYMNVSATYTFIPGSFLEGGFTQDINATDVVAPGSNGQLTQYQQSSIAYLNLTHKFDSKLTGSLVGQYVYSKFKDGAYNDQADNTIGAGVSLNYQINSRLWADLGYNFDELFSDVPGRAYNRNRVYIGLGANY